MRGWRRSVAVAGVVLGLLPAAAAAQSAGDDQYADPFGDQEQQSEQATPTPAPAQPAQPAQATPAAPAAPAPEPPTTRCPAGSG